MRLITLAFLVLLVACATDDVVQTCEEIEVHWCGYPEPARVCCLEHVADGRLFACELGYRCNDHLTFCREHDCSDATWRFPCPEDARWWEGRDDRWWEGPDGECAAY